MDINKDGVIDYQEFLTLVKGRHLGLGSKRRKAFRLLLKETVEFLVPYKYTYQVGRYRKVLKRKLEDNFLSWFPIFKTQRSLDSNMQLYA